jgi:hypothetical protein
MRLIVCSIALLALLPGPGRSQTGWAGNLRGIDTVAVLVVLNDEATELDVSKQVLEAPTQLELEGRALWSVTVRSCQSSLWR